MNKPFLSVRQIRELLLDVDVRLGVYEKMLTNLGYEPKMGRSHFHDAFTHAQRNVKRLARDLEITVKGLEQGELLPTDEIELAQFIERVRNDP